MYLPPHSYKVGKHYREGRREMFNFFVCLFYFSVRLETGMHIAVTFALTCSSTQTLEELFLEFPLKSTKCLHYSGLYSSLG